MSFNLTFNELPEAVARLIGEVRGLKEMLREQCRDENRNETDVPDLITIDEACELLNISRGTLYRHQRKGKLKVYGIGGRRLLKLSEVMDSLTLKKIKS